MSVATIYWWDNKLRIFFYYEMWTEYAQKVSRNFVYTFLACVSLIAKYLHHKNSLQPVKIGRRVLQKANFPKSLAKKVAIDFLFFHNNIPIRKKKHNNIVKIKMKISKFLGYSVASVAFPERLNAFFMHKVNFSMNFRRKICL